MSILKTLDQYNPTNLYFCDTIKNNVMPNGNFIRILYCMFNFTMNGIYLHIPFRNVEVEKYYQKHKFIFDKDEHSDIVKKIIDIEKNILFRIQGNMDNKSPQFKVKEQVTNGCIKLHLPDLTFDTKNVSLVLKISGIWETEFNYGLTYKFSRVEPVFNE